MRSFIKLLMKIPLQVVVAVLWLVLYGVSLTYVDQPLTAALAQVHWPSWVWQLANGVTALAKPMFWSGIMLLGLLSVSISYVKAGYQLTSKSNQRLCLSLALFLALTIGSLLKIALRRCRPELWLSSHSCYGFLGFQGLNVPHLYGSTPSGHTLCAFTLAVGIAHFKPHWRFPLLLLASLIAFSRVMLLQHYLSDVLLGAYIGMMSALIINSLFYPTTNLS